MSKFVDKILKEAEDSSDDFFRSKHINKRKEEIRKREKAKRDAFNKKKKGYFYKLNKCLERIRIYYKSKNWEDDGEELFLKSFSELFVDNKFYSSMYEHGYILSNIRNNKMYFYDIINNELWINSDSLWMFLETQFDKSYNDIRTFINKMFEKYFKLHDTEVLYDWPIDL